MANRKTRCGYRGGYLYVAVLLTALGVSTMGLVALSVASLRFRSASDANDWATAQILAQSAVEDAVRTIRANNAWRSAFAHNVEYPLSGQSLGDGSFTWKLIDSDGVLDDDDSDTVRIIGICRLGRATAADSVRLMPTGDALDCLESALQCQGNIFLGTGVQFATDARLSSNGNITATGFLTSIEGNVEAAGTIIGTINGTTSEGITPRRMPGSCVLDYYLDNGTEIPLNSIPTIGGVHTIEKCVLSPQANPFGQRNAEGVYVIYCDGSRVRVRDCRIAGTIVMLNPGANSSLEGSVRWDAAAGNYPTLLVLGDFTVRTTPNDLSESIHSTNFNPAGTPYQGNADSDMMDAYPSEINGLVYVSGNLSAPQDLLASHFRGITICASISATSNCRFNYRPLLYEYPPPGFASGNPMVIVPGSRRRETLP